MTVPKTAEHEVKVRFAREFADVDPVTENLCLAPESLSSVSSFHSLSSTLSTKSSSDVYPDLTLETPDDAADTSYVNSNIPGVEDLILACADIHLGSECDGQDLSQDQTFASATDEIPFSTGDYSFNEDLFDNADNVTQVIETTPQLHETTSLNQTHSLGASNTLLVQDSQFVISYPPAEEYVLQVEESIDKHIPLQENDNIVSELETCDVASSIIKDSLPSNELNDNQLNVTTTVSSADATFNVIALSEEQAVENDCISETLPLEDPQLCPTEISVPSISSLAQYADLSLPSISSISPLEDNKTQETSIEALSELKQSTSTVLSPSDNLDQNSCVLSQIDVNNSVVQAESNEIIKEQELSQLDNRIDEKDNIRLLNTTSIVEPKTSEVEENLQTSIDKKDLETENSVVLNETQKLSEEEIAISNETRVIEKQCNSSETVTKEQEEEKYITESAAATSSVKKETSIEDLERTLTLQEIDINFEPDEELYEEFKPQRQSTTLSLINGELSIDIEELKATVEKVTNELLDPSLELTEDTDQFVSATPEIFQDPSTFDFLLARSNSTHINRLRAESLYVKFDPLVSNTSMLPQGNTQTINEEEKKSKNESPLPNIGTPKHNPAIAAIDRLLFYSPLPNATVQKLEEAQEKNEQAEEPKSEAPLIDHVDMSKELELVRTTVLQLEEELEKQKKEHEAELERQKATFQEKLNKLQTQMAQEIKTKTQMTVVVEEYEKSISRLLTERERDRTSFEQDKAKLQEELQAANHHLTNTEAAFNDVHQKYERLKGVVSVYKNNESVLKESIQENVETIKTLETRYDQLKEHAMTQLEKANLELDGIRKQNEAETVKLHALIRKAELKSNSLTELVEQKTKENKELAKILDEVIARVGHGNSE